MQCAQAEINVCVAHGGWFHHQPRMYAARAKLDGQKARETGRQRFLRKWGLDPRVEGYGMPKRSLSYRIRSRIMRVDSIMNRLSQVGGLMR